MKVLCLFAHYFNPEGVFKGKSKFQDASIRHEIVKNANSSLEKIAALDVIVVGFKSKSLVPVDIDFSKKIEDPRLLIYEAFSFLNTFKHEYDYFIVIEDDILMREDVLNNVLEFDSKNDITEIFHPNRIEKKKEGLICIDLASISGETGNQKNYNGRLLKEYKNPHSAISIVSRSKLEYATSQTDLSFRGIIIGGFMASAFANFHRPFTLYRVSDGNDFHTVEHLDIYEERGRPNLFNRVINKIGRFKNE